MDALPDLRIHRLRLTWRAAEAVAPPVGLGEALRGLLGRRLAEQAPTVFARLFPSENGGATPPWCWRYRVVDEAQVLVTAELILVNADAALGARIAVALSDMDSLQVTRHGVLPPMRLVGLHEDGRALVPGLGESQGCRLIELAARILAEAESVTLLTPAVIEGARALPGERRRCLDADGMTAAHLVQAARQRLLNLAASLGLPWDPPPLAPVTAAGRFVDAVFPYKGRTKPAVLGTIDLAGLPEPAALALAAACLLNLGRHALVGAGVLAPAGRVRNG